MRASARTVVALVLIAGGLSACNRLPAPTGATGPSVLVKDGVVGRWALDCAKPFSVENPHLLYSLPSSGGASEQVLMDAKHDRTTTLLDIAELEGGFVQWSQKAGQGLATIVTKIDGSRLQTWHAKHSDGLLMVEKGHYAGGSEVPWFSRCAAN